MSVCVCVCVCVCVLSDIAQADLLCKLVKDSMSVEQATALWRYVLKLLKSNTLKYVLPITI